MSLADRQVVPPRDVARLSTLMSGKQTRVSRQLSSSNSAKTLPQRQCWQLKAWLARQTRRCGLPCRITMHPRTLASQCQPGRRHHLFQG